MHDPNKEQVTYYIRNTQKMQRVLSRPCVDCNLLWHPFVMTFDHVDRATKKYVISDARSLHPKAFDRELQKCEVVCKNCHGMREYLRDMHMILRAVREANRPKHNYYRELVPYLAGGALLRKDAFEKVRI